MKPTTIGALALLALPLLYGTGAVLRESLAARMGVESDAAPRNGAEAAAIGNPAAMLRFLRAGEDPTAVYPLREDFISSTVRRATLLEAAVYSGRVELIHLLDREGALSRDGERHALACLASDLRQTDIVEFLAPAEAVCEAGAARAAVLARTTNAASTER